MTSGSSVWYTVIMGEEKAFTSAVIDTDPLSRHGIHAALTASHLQQSLTIAWEAESLEDAILKIEELPADILILNMPEYNFELIHFLNAVSVGCSVTRKLLIASAPGTPDICYRLLEAGLDGYLTQEEAQTSLAGAVSFLMSGIHCFSGRFMEKAIPVLATSRTVELSQTFFDLTAREQEVLELMTKGCSNAEIARLLSISQRTVRHHSRSICDKLGVATPSQAIVRILTGQIE
jgi:DNA-binding NarL/FixJ family response regulator